MYPPNAPDRFQVYMEIILWPEQNNKKTVTLKFWVGVQGKRILRRFDVSPQQLLIRYSAKC